MSGRRTMAQMWQQVDHLKDVIRRQHDKAEKRNAEIKALKAENAKLRNLVRDTLPFIAEESGFCTADCFMYPACCEDMSDVECPAVACIHERARDLGVDWRGAESAAVIHRGE